MDQQDRGRTDQWESGGRPGLGARVRRNRSGTRPARGTPPDRYPDRMTRSDWISISGIVLSTVIGIISIAVALYVYRKQYGPQAPIQKQGSQKQDQPQTAEQSEQQESQVAETPPGFFAWLIFVPVSNLFVEIGNIIKTLVHAALQRSERKQDVQAEDGQSHQGTTRLSEEIVPSEEEEKQEDEVDEPGPAEIARGDLLGDLTGTRPSQPSNFHEDLSSINRDSTDRDGPGTIQP